MDCHPVVYFDLFSFKFWWFIIFCFVWCICMKGEGEGRNSWRGVLDTTLGDKVTAGLCFFLSTLVSSTNKTDHHDIAEILLKLALNQGFI